MTAPRRIQREWAEETAKTAYAVARGGRPLYVPLPHWDELGDDLRRAFVFVAECAASSANENSGTK